MKKFTEKEAGLTIKTLKELMNEFDESENRLEKIQEAEDLIIEKMAAAEKEDNKKAVREANFKMIDLEIEWDKEYKTGQEKLKKMRTIIMKVTGLNEREAHTLLLTNKDFFDFENMLF